MASLHSTRVFSSDVGESVLRFREAAQVSLLSLVSKYANLRNATGLCDLEGLAFRADHTGLSLIKVVDDSPPEWSIEILGVVLGNLLQILFPQRHLHILADSIFLAVARPTLCNKSFR